MVILVIIITTFSIKMVDHGPYKIVVLYPDLFDNISIQTMALMRQNLLPHNVTLIQTTPGQAFFAQIYVAALLALILTIPVITKETISFIGPGLYRRERVFIKKITLFGWNIQKWPGSEKLPEGMEYWIITTTDSKGNKSLTGGMMKRQNAQQHGITNFIDVKSIDEYSSRLEQLGGKMVTPKMPVPGMGYFATCLDTENNSFAIWETNSEAK